MATFQVRINEGDEQSVTINNGLYLHAAIVAFHTLKFPNKRTLMDGQYWHVIKIWDAELVKPLLDKDGKQIGGTYGPYYYACNEYQSEFIEVHMNTDEQWIGDSSDKV